MKWVVPALHPRNPQHWWQRWDRQSLESWNTERIR